VIDALMMIVGALIGSLGFCFGWLVGRITRKPTDPNRPICGCKHSAGFHENGIGKCNGFDSWNEKTCRCLKYTGPVPLDSIYAPPIEGTSNG